MQFKPKSIKRFQQGGPMPTEEEMPVEGSEEMPVENNQMQGGQEDPMMMLAQGAAQALQSQDCQMAMQVCQGLLQLLQAMSQQQAPAAEETGEPVFKKGGVLVRRIKK